jgi:predicted metal-binding protein
MCLLGVMGMPKLIEELDKDLRTMALESGASAFKFIEPRDIVTANWVRQKCKFGCKNYGTRYTCPPYSPSPEETRKVLDEYTKAYIIKYEGFLGFDEYPPKRLNDAMTDLSLHVCKAAYNMERHAFLSGYYKAFSYGAHRCRKCDVCAVVEGDKGCRFPFEARPSIESSGIDVFKTSENAGLGTSVVLDKVITGPKQLPTFTLLLIE